MGVKSIRTDEYSALLRRLVSARKEAGVTQQELAARLGRPQSFVSKYERQERRLDVIEFIGICRVLGMSASDIVRELEGRSVPERNRKGGRAR